MRISGYNMVLPLRKSDDYLIIQGAKGSFDIVDSTIADFLQGKTTLEDSDITGENLAILKQRGYITDETEEEEFNFIRKLSQAINERGKKYINVTIMPTYNCNFRCEYCFERNLQKNGKEWLSAKMTPAIADAIFVQLAKYREEGCKLEGIYLFGGEPLLRSNKDIVSYICEKARQMELPISCISNGYDLDAYVDLICEYGFRYVQITVDGIGEEHNKRRFLVGGQGTFDRIMENVNLALDKGVNIVLRSNVNRKNIREIPRLIEYYREKGWLENEHFKYYFKSTMRCYDELKDAYSDTELMEELSQYYSEHTDRFQFNSIYHGIAEKIGYMLKNNSFAPMRSGYCGANMGMYTVDPFGDIYPCWDVLSDKDECIGTVDTETGTFVMNENHDRWKCRTVDTLEECRNCPYMMFCGGGCAAQAKVMHNDIRRVYCDGFQNLFNQVAVEMCEEFISQSEQQEMAAAE